MSLFDPGKKDRQRAAQLAQQGIIKGAGVTGPGGLSAGFDFSRGKTSMTSSLGSFAPLLEMLQSGAAGQFGQMTGGLNGDFVNAANSSVDRLGQMNVNQLTNESDFNALGQLFQTAMGQANRDPFDVGNEISTRLRALSERGNQRLVSRAMDRLKSTGNLGSAAGAGQMAELDANLFDEGLKFDLAGLDFGQRSINDAFARALGASQQREAIGGRQFAESFGMEQLGGERALQQFGINQQMFQNLLAQQAQGGQMGMGLLSGAMGLSQLPLAFLQAAQGAGTSASNSLFAAAGINQQNAAMAKSPFLEALNAAGSFMGGIAPGGFFGKPT